MKSTITVLVIFAAALCVLAVGAFAVAITNSLGMQILLVLFAFIGFTGAACAVVDAL